MGRCGVWQTGRGQAVAPAMPAMKQPVKGVHSRGDGLSSPCCVKFCCTFASTRKASKPELSRGSSARCAARAQIGYCSKATKKILLLGAASPRRKLEFRWEVAAYSIEAGCR